MEAPPPAAVYVERPEIGEVVPAAAAVHPFSFTSEEVQGVATKGTRKALARVRLPLASNRGIWSVVMEAVAVFPDSRDFDVSLKAAHHGAQVEVPLHIAGSPVSRN